MENITLEVGKFYQTRDGRLQLNLGIAMAVMEMMAPMSSRRILPRKPWPHRYLNDHEHRKAIGGRRANVRRMQILRGRK